KASANGKASTRGLIHFSYISGVSIERNLSDISAFIKTYAEPSFIARYVSRNHAINNAGVLIAFLALLLNGLGG
ncbi:6083_t:CDS:1, partial [Funneliformis caledonium]